jgi:hypothetical protein
MIDLPCQFQEPESGIPGWCNGAPDSWPAADRAYVQGAIGISPQRPRD